MVLWFIPDSVNNYMVLIMRGTKICNLYEDYFFEMCFSCTSRFGCLLLDLKQKLMYDPGVKLLTSQQKLGFPHSIVCIVGYFYFLILEPVGSQEATCLCVMGR